MRFVVYNLETGKIRKTVHSGRNTDPFLQVKNLELESVKLIEQEELISDKTHWVDPALIEIVERPTVSLASVPAGTQIFIDRVDYGLCNDGSLEIETDLPGSYQIELLPPFPYQPLKTVIEVV